MAQQVLFLFLNIKISSLRCRKGPWNLKRRINATIKNQQHVVNEYYNHGSVVQSYIVQQIIF